MEKFIARYRSLVTGVLSGFDRLVFRGSLLPLFRDGGMESSESDKEKIAQRVPAEQPIDRGLINYFVHPQFGFMSARLQTWFPFNVEICLNGREWLARQLRRRRSDFKRADNCFTWLGNLERAQPLMDEQLQTDWPAVLDLIARRLNPLHAEIFQAQPIDYYWSGYQTEWATLRLNDPADLALLNAVSRGEFAPAGFRNRDVRGLIHHPTANATSRDRRRLSAKGLLVTAALQATRRANIKDLLKAA